MFQHLFFYLSAQLILCSIPVFANNSWITNEELPKEFCDWEGDDGSKDLNRVHVSDPVLKELVGEIKGKTIGDFGCGCGYLSRYFAVAGAKKVYAIDPSPYMIRKARTLTPLKYLPTIDYLQEDGANPTSVKDNSLDILISNYVLMHASDLDAHARAIYRVLAPGGKAIVVVLHPIYTMNATNVSNQDRLRLYFQKHFVDVLLNGMSKSIRPEHRWLSNYLNAFLKTGLSLVDFREPHLDDKERRESGLPENLGSEPVSMILVLQKKEEIIKTFEFSPIWIQRPEMNSDTIRSIAFQYVLEKTAVVFATSFSTAYPLFLWMSGTNDPTVKNRLKILSVVWVSLIETGKDVLKSFHIISESSFLEGFFEKNPS